MQCRVASAGAPVSYRISARRVGGEAVAMWRGFRGRRLDRAAAVVFCFILVGCAARPGPEVLTPVAASSGEKALQIYVATTRERESSSGNGSRGPRRCAQLCKVRRLGAAQPQVRQSRDADRNPRSAEQFRRRGSGRAERSRFSQGRRSARRYQAKKAQGLRFRARVQQQLLGVAVPAGPTAGGHQDRRDSDPVRLAIARSGRRL